MKSAPPIANATGKRVEIATSGFILLAQNEPLCWYTICTRVRELKLYTVVFSPNNIFILQTKLQKQAESGDKSAGILVCK